MELNSHTMSTDFSDYRISVFYCMFMNCTSHISDRSPWFHLGNTNLNTFFCDLDKFFFLRTHFTDAEHSGRVRIITIIYCRYINIDNISLFQNLLFIRDSMAYHFIYRSTHALWKSFVIKWCRYSAHLGCFLVYQIIYILSCHSCMNILCNIIKHSNINLAAFSHSCKLFFILNNISWWYLMKLSLEII